MPMEQMQKFLRHAKLETTQRGCRIYPGDEARELPLGVGCLR
jgi:hypothetical protein